MARKRAKQPNVIVFFTDQQRWDTTGVHGNPLDLTPNFDRMAQEGTHVANAFTPQPGNIAPRTTSEVNHGFGAEQRGQLRCQRIVERVMHGRFVEPITG